MGENDFFSAEFQRDPYTHYARLRTEDPVHWHEFQGERRVSLLRYEDVASALRDPRFGCRSVPSEVLEKLLASGNEDLVNLARVESSVIVSQDPPEHTRVRNQLARAFTARRVAALQGLIESVVTERIDALELAGRADLIADFAVPVPLGVIGRLLGTPSADLPRLRRWSGEIGALLDPMQRAAGGLPRAVAAVGEFKQYFRKIVDARRREPGDDIVSALVSVDDEERLSEDELLVNCAFVLVAGFETTSNLIGNGVLALLREPDQLERLRQEPKRLDSAIEELLRFDSPVQRTSRTTNADVEVGGQLLPRGTRVGLVLGSANRDPERFADPDRLDIAREDNRHLAFGGGSHFCLGAALARLEGRLAFGQLFARLPRLQLACEELEWVDAAMIRALKALPVRF